MSIEQDMINEDLARDRAEQHGAEMKQKEADMLEYIWTQEGEMLEVLDEVRNTEDWLLEFGSAMNKKDYIEASKVMMKVIMEKAHEHAETLVRMQNE